MPDFDLSNKVLVMIVGPTAVGKSTLMNEVVKQDDKFARVHSFTTRQPRTNDEPGHYIYLSAEELEQKRQSGSIITDIIFPTTGIHYGTVQESYSNEYNILDTLAHSVADYESLGFKRTITISVTADPVDWNHWLEQRFPGGGDDMRQRLEEAVLSMQWSLAQSNNHHWIVNKPGQVSRIAQTLIAIATGRSNAAIQPAEARKAYETARHLLSYGEKEE